MLAEPYSLEIDRKSKTSEDFFSTLRKVFQCFFNDVRIAIGRALI